MVKDSDQLFRDELDESASVYGDVTETLEKRREALQAHEFRDVAFNGGRFLCAAVGFVWVLLIANSPDASDPKEAFYLWGAKTSLCTIVFITIAIGLLRFAIKCYGHHQRPVQDNETVSPKKIAEAALTVAQKAME